VGFISDLFDPEARRKNRIASLTKKMTQKFGQTEDRMGAAVALSREGEDGIRALLKRFTNTCDNHTHDQTEKQDVSDMLVEFGPQAIPPIRDFLAREKEVTWAMKTLARLVDRKEWLDIVLGTIEGKDSENTDSEKINQILLELHETKDPRAVATAARYLEDLNDTVRFTAIETLASIEDEAAHAPLLTALTKPEEESQRVRHRIIELFVERGWEVKGFRKAVEDRLPEGFYLDRSGRIKQLEAGATRPPEA
jgi:hypothetical protein